jgi:hypothetical protein
MRKQRSFIYDCWPLFAAFALATLTVACFGADQKPLVINPTTGKQEQLQPGNYITLPNSAGALIRFVVGTSTPEGAITAGVGSMFYRTDGGTGTTLYIKESGTGNTGWVAVAASSGGITGSGTTGLIPLFTGATAIGNSALTEGANDITSTKRIVTPATGTARSGFNLPPGTAPSAPVNGDAWTTSSGYFIRANGATVGPMIGGTVLGGGRVPFATASQTFSESAKFTWSNSTGLTVNFASTGANNLTIGANAGLSLTSGTQNTILGAQSGFSWSNVSNNTAVGYDVLSNATGAGNTAVGATAANAVTSSTGITTVGFNSLGATTGADNTALGTDAGQSNTSGTQNTFVGRSANSSSAATLSNMVVVGYLATSSAADTVSLGASSSATSTGSIAIGQGATGSGTDSVTIGKGSNGTGSSVSFGGISNQISTLYLGMGATADATPADITVTGSVPGASNTAGANLNVRAGLGTGTNVSGDVNVQVSFAGSSGVTPGTPVTTVKAYNTGSVHAGRGTVATNATEGFLYIPTCAGTPTGAPTARSGYAPMVIDTTNHKLYFYSGGAWRDAGP